MQSLEKIGQKRKLLTDKQQKLLEKAMSSTANAAKKKSKAKVTRSAKRVKTPLIVLDFWVVHVQRSWLVFIVRKTYIW